MASENYRRDIALFIADAAKCRATVTYGDLAMRFGGIARGYGAILTAIAREMHKDGHPLLPILVVSAKTGLPSVDAAIYKELGIDGEEDIRDQQRLCYECDWGKVFAL